MYKPKTLTPAMNASFTLIETLANKGQFRLAMKTLIYAVRLDWTMFCKRKTARKFNKKLERLEMESFIIESQIWQILNTN